MKATVFLFLILQCAYCKLEASDFITKWDLSLPGSSSFPIWFQLSASSPVGYFWETIPAGSSGSGYTTLSDVNIIGLPGNSVILLHMNTSNLESVEIDSDRLIDIVQWGSTNWTSMYNAFNGCSNLQISAADIPNLSLVTNMTRMFAGCIMLNGPSNINSWNTSSVTDMSWMFGTAISFNQPLSSWNTSNVINMAGMFYYAGAFNQNLDNWSINNVETTERMFYGAYSFNQPIGNWHTDHVLTMKYMFSYASAFNQPIGNWNTSSVTDMSWMFYNDTSFNQAIGTWDVSSVTDMSHMFMQAFHFNQPIGTWDVSSVTNMDAMFSYSAFNQPIGNWNTSNCQNMAFMFSYDSSFNQNINNWDIHNVTSIAGMFSNSLSFNQPLELWNTSNVIYMGKVFYYAESFNQPLSTWDTGNTLSMWGMFGGALNFNQPIDNWNVSQVLEMSHMFADAVLFNQPLGSWNTASCHGMEGMFAGAVTFNQSLGNWELDSNQNYINMLDNCGMDCMNYYSTLTGWSNNPSMSNGIIFGVANIHYGNYANSVRDFFINNKGWSFIGDISDSVGCSPTGTGSLDLTHDFSVFPNPSSGNCTIKFNNRSGENGIVRIMNTLGEIVFEKNTGVSSQQIETIEIPNLPQGTYFIELFFGTEKFTKRIDILQ